MGYFVKKTLGFKVFLTNGNIANICFVLATALMITFAGVVWKQDFFRILPLYISLIVGMGQSYASRYASLVGGINCILYTVVYISFGLYAQAANALLISCPLQIATFIRWSKHKYKNSTEFRKLSPKGRLIAATIFGICFVTVYFILIAVNSSYQLLDTGLTLIAIFTSVLTLFSYIEYSWLMLGTGLLSIALDIAMIPERPAQITYLIFSIYSLICISRQFFAVRNLYKEQIKIRKDK